MDFISDGIEEILVVEGALGVPVDMRLISDLVLLVDFPFDRDEVVRTV